MVQLINHYNWLEKHFPEFLEKIGLDFANCPGIVGAHGDKCYGYRYIWKEKGIPFHHGAALYLLTYLSPYNKEVRETDNGWVAPDQWVIDNYSKFLPLFKI